MVPVPFNLFRRKIFPIDSAIGKFDKGVGADNRFSGSFAVTWRVKQIPFRCELAFEFVACIHAFGVKGFHFPGLIGFLDKETVGRLELRLAAVIDKPAKLKRWT